jgi:O-antigen ligase
MRKVAYISLLVLIFTIPWEDAFTIGAFGSVTRIIGLLTAIIWLGCVLVSGKIRKPNWFHFLVFLFILWNIASVFWSVSLNESQRQIQTYLQLGLVVYILWDLITTSKKLEIAMQTYVFGAYVTIFSTILNYITGRQIADYSGGRYSGAGVNAVDLSLTLALGLPLAWHLAISLDNTKNNQIIKLINYFFVPAALFAIILTGSRSAIFEAIPAFVYILVTLSKIKPVNRLLIFIFMVGSLLIIQPYIPQSVLDRLSTTGSSIASGDLGRRVYLWRNSLSIFQTKPIFGIGSGALLSPTQLGSVAHNTFLSILTELGLLGFATFMIMLVIVSINVLVQMKSKAQLWLSILSIWAIGAFTLTWEYRKTTWFFLTLIVISASLFGKESAETETDGLNVLAAVPFNTNEPLRNK